MARFKPIDPEAPALSEKEQAEIDDAIDDWSWIYDSRAKYDSWPKQLEELVWPDFIAEQKAAAVAQWRLWQRHFDREILRLARQSKSAREQLRETFRAGAPAAPPVFNDIDARDVVVQRLYKSILALLRRPTSLEARRDAESSLASARSVTPAMLEHPISLQQALDWLRRENAKYPSRGRSRSNQAVVLVERVTGYGASAVRDAVGRTRKQRSKRKSTVSRR